MMKKRKNPFTYYLPHIAVVDYKRAKRKDFPLLSDGQYSEMKSAPYIIGDDGMVYINKQCEQCQIYVQFFVTMSDESTLALIQALDQAKKKYSDVKSGDDIRRYEKKYDLQGIGFLFMIPLELERRKNMNSNK